MYGLFFWFSNEWVSVNWRLWKKDSDEVLAYYDATRDNPMVQKTLSLVLARNSEAASRLPELNSLLEVANCWMVQGRYWPVGGWASRSSDSGSPICLGLEIWVWALRTLWPAFTQQSAIHEMIHAAQEVREGALTRESGGNTVLSPMPGAKTKLSLEMEAYTLAPLTGVFFSLMTLLVTGPVVVYCLSMWFWATVALLALVTLRVAYSLWI